MSTNQKIVCALLVAVPALVTCSGPATGLCISSAELRGAHPSRGGHNMFLTRQHDVWMQIVEPTRGGPLIERRYRRHASDAEVAELRQIVEETSLLKMKDAQRQGASSEVLWR